MVTTPHALVGITLAVIIPDKPLALFLALLSHFVFDFSLPHWNPHLYDEMAKNKRLSTASINFIILDALLAVILVLLAIFLYALPDLTGSLVIMLAAFLSVLPDLVEIPYYFFGCKNMTLARYVAFEHKYQAKAGKTAGILAQVVVSIICLLVLTISS